LHAYCKQNCRFQLKRFTPMDEVENDNVKFWIEDNVIYGSYKKGSILTKESVKDVIKLRLNFQKGKIQKAIAYITHIHTITPEARQYLAREGYEGLEKLGMITNSRMITLLGNLFIMVNKHVKSTRLFTNKEDALAWLFMKEKNSA
jgi:hypothetical protein